MMQAIGHEPEYVKGLEVLSFDSVELEKTQDDGAQTFAAVGKLSVLYFDYYERFVLQLDNWRYCLLPRLPLIASSNPMTSTGTTYVMPAYDGSYNLKLNNISNRVALSNLETILSNTTKLRRQNLQESQPMPMPMPMPMPQNQVIVNEVTTRSLGPYTTVEQNVREFYERPIEPTYITPATSTYTNANSGMKKSKLKSGINKLKDKMSKKKSRKMRNPNMTEIRDFLAIKSTPEEMVPVIEVRRQEIETAIVSAKEIARKIEGPPQDTKESLKEKVIGFVDAVKEGVSEMKERIDERHDHEARTGEKVGIMEIVKEGIHDIKDKIAGKKHEDEIRGGPGTMGTVPGVGVAAGTGEKVTLTTAIMAGISEFKSKLAERSEQNQASGEKGGIMSMVKGGVSTLKEKIGARHGGEEGEEHPTLMEKLKGSVMSMKEKFVGRTGGQQGTPSTAEKDILYYKEEDSWNREPDPNLRADSESSNIGAIPLQTRNINYGTSVQPITTRQIQLEDVLLNNTSTATRGGEGRLKIFDDKYLDQPIHDQPFPISGAAGVDMVQNFENYAQPPHVVEQMHLLREREAQPHPETTEPRIIDKLKAKIGMGEPNPDRPGSPMRKRELLKAAFPVFMEKHIHKNVDSGENQPGLSDKVKASGTEAHGTGMVEGEYAQEGHSSSLKEKMKAVIPAIKEKVDILKTTCRHNQPTTETGTIIVENVRERGPDTVVVHREEHTYTDVVQQPESVEVDQTNIGRHLPEQYSTNRTSVESTSRPIISFVSDRRGQENTNNTQGVVHEEVMTHHYEG